MPPKFPFEITTFWNEDNPDEGTFSSWVWASTEDRAITKHRMAQHASAFADQQNAGIFETDRELLDNLKYQRSAWALVSAVRLDDLAVQLQKFLADDPNVR